VTNTETRNIIQYRIILRIKARPQGSWRHKVNIVYFILASVVI